MGRTARNTDRAGTLTDGPGPVVVGILNVTPDSFSDGGDFLDPEAAAEHAAAMVDEGADVLDVGGESTRPGSDPVSQEEEIRRVVPVLERILSVRPEGVISVDTNRGGTATAALEAGASLVNDVTALRGDPHMAPVVADARCPVVLMHMQGEPKTMQSEPRYEDVVSEVEETYENVNLGRRGPKSVLETVNATSRPSGDIAAAVRPRVKRQTSRPAESTRSMSTILSGLRFLWT